jgi:hypothetical protein
MQNLGLPLKMDHEENGGLNVLKDRFTDETVKIESQGGLLMMRGAKFNVKHSLLKSMACRNSKRSVDRLLEEKDQRLLMLLISTTLIKC